GRTCRVAARHRPLGRRRGTRRGDRRGSRGRRLLAAVIGPPRPAGRHRRSSDAASLADPRREHAGPRRDLHRRGGRHVVRDRLAVRHDRGPAPALEPARERRRHRGRPGAPAAL
ncbi:MAG: hypothetical protein AVDCRST_MAG88-2972, partial [uncultured Thermomicrobiales bacterium]